MKSLVSKENNTTLTKGSVNPLIIITAPSGSGKSTLIQKLLAEFDGFAFSISATTRTPRGKEKHGEDYYFITIQEFEKAIKHQQFLEWEMVYKGLYYGTFKSEISRIGKLGKVPLLDIDVQGALKLSEHFGAQALKIFIKPPSLEILEQRLRHRATDHEDKIRERISKAKEELTFEDQFDVVIVNDHLDTAYLEFRNAIEQFIQPFKE